MNKALHGFDGSCRPGPNGELQCCGQTTFSVGIFQILPKANGKGTKRGPVKVRVKGNVSNPEAVLSRARAIVDQLDAGTYSGPKNVKA